MSANPLEVDGDKTLGEVFTHMVEDDSSLYPEINMSAENFLSNVVNEVDANEMVFLAQYSLREGVSIFGNKAIEAIKEELQGIVENAVGDPKRWRDVPQQVRKKIIPTKMIITPKMIASVIDRLKGRLVVLGNLEKEDDRYIRAPMPSITTIMIQAAGAAAEGRYVITFDVSQALTMKNVHQASEESFRDSFVYLPRVSRIRM